MRRQRAHPAWAATPADERAPASEPHRRSSSRRALEEFASARIARQRQDGGARRTSLDIPRAISNLRFFAAAVTQFASEAHADARRALNYTLRQPLGVVGCISPWNLPLYLFTWKIAPALAAGNTVVAKPSEVTPFTPAMFARGLHRRPVCRPACSTSCRATGPGAGQALVEHAGDQGDLVHRLHAHRRRDRRRRGAEIQEAVARNGRQESRRSCSPTGTRAQRTSTRSSARRSPTRARSACAARASSSSARSTSDFRRTLRGQGASAARRRSARCRRAISARSSRGAFRQGHGPHRAGARGRRRESCAAAMRRNVGGRCADGWFIAPTVIEGLAAELPHEPGRNLRSRSSR